MKFHSFNDLYHQIFREVNATEKKWLSFLPELINRVHSEELREALSTYHSDLQKHAKKFEELFEEKQIKRDKSEFSPIDSIVLQMEEVLRNNESSHLLDAAIIAYLQKIEHLDVATYGTLRAYADLLKESTLKSWLKEMVKREAKMDLLISKLAVGEEHKTGINERAA